MRKRSLGVILSMTLVTPSTRVAILPPSMLPEVSSTKVQSTPSEIRCRSAAGVTTTMNVPVEPAPWQYGMSSTLAGTLSSRR